MKWIFLQLLLILILTNFIYSQINSVKVTSVKDTLLIEERINQLTQQETYLLIQELEQKEIEIGNIQKSIKKERNIIIIESATIIILLSLIVIMKKKMKKSQK